MAYNTYDDLAQALQEYMEDDDAEFTQSIDDVISVGENRVVKDINLALFRRGQSTTLVVGQAVFAKPTPLSFPTLAIKHAFLSDAGLPAGRTVTLENRSQEYVNDYNNGAANGEPKYYADHDENNLCVAPPPDDTYTFNTRVQVVPDRLAPGQQTNWLTDNVPELLFRACLAEAEKFLKDEDRAPVWENDYVALLATTKRDLYPQQNTDFERVGGNSVPQGPRSQTA